MNIIYCPEKSYTYLIGWSEIQKYYYGVRYANSVSPENDLWKSYFTSSKFVAEYREFYGEPDVIQIRKTFDSQQKALDWELKVLSRMDAVNSENWINKAAFPAFYVGEETRKKISESQKGNGNSQYGKMWICNTTSKMNQKINKTDEIPIGWIKGRNKWPKQKKNKNCPCCGQNFLQKTKEIYCSSDCKKNSRNIISGKDHNSFGTIRSEETKKKMSKAKSGKNNPRYGKPVSEETRRKISEAALRRWRKSSSET